VRAIAEIEVPDSVQAVLAARIDRLDELAKQTLQAAAVIGLEFLVPVLEEVANIPRRDVDAALHTLAAADLVYQLAAYPEVEYAFKHPLTQSVAYDTQLGAPRRRAHARIARVLERRHEDKLDEKAGLIAYHWEEAGEQLEGARWHARAARWLESRDVDEALRHWRKTRSLLGGERDLSPEEAELATVACTQVLNLGWRQGMDEEEAARVFAEGREFADGGGGARTHALLLTAFGTYRGINHGGEEMVDWSDRALELAGELDDPSLTLMLFVNRVVGLQHMGRLQESLEQAEHGIKRTIELGLAETLRWESFHVVSNLTLQAGANRYWIGRFEEGRTTLEEAVALARHHRDAETTCFAQSFLAECCAGLGDLESALRHGREAVEVAEKYTSRHSAIWADRGLGRALIANDRPSEACTVLERALAAMRDRRIHVSLDAELLQLLAEAHLGLGQQGRAREECVAAIAAALRSGSPHWECDAQLVLSRVLLREGAPGPAAAGETGAALDRAAELIDQTGFESRRPRLFELRAELAHAQGDAATRERHLREAHRLYTEMGATGHAERMAKELGL
jgi:adenylate cyclase